MVHNPIERVAHYHAPVCGLSTAGALGTLRHEMKANPDHQAKTKVTLDSSLACARYARKTTQMTECTNGPKRKRNSNNFSGTE